MLDSDAASGALASSMRMGRDVDLLSAAGDLCSAADRLRAVGLVMLAEEIDAVLATLEVEILLGTLVRD